jgi:hypothetical protein
MTQAYVPTADPLTGLGGFIFGITLVLDTYFNSSRSEPLGVALLLGFVVHCVSGYADLFQLAFSL